MLKASVLRVLYSFAPAAAATVVPVKKVA